jgi:hypothetical protein
MAPPQVKGGKTATSKEVAAAIAALQDYHARGGQLLRDFPVGTPVQEDAQRQGMNIDYLRAMRKFGDKKRGYTVAELKKLCGRCRKYHRALGFSYVVRFLSISDRTKRGRFERDVIQRGWSCARMDMELLARFGRQRQSGRTVQDVRTVSELLVTLESRCIQWSRLERQLLKWSGKGARPVKWSKVPANVRGQFLAVANSAKELQRIVASRLQRSRS